MKRLLALLAALLALGSFVGPAQGQRIVLGLHFGVPLYWPAPYPYYSYPPPPYSYYYAPPVYASPATPLPPPAYAEGRGAYWYYCPESKTYYPYVRECPGGWERVPTVPPR